MHYSTTTGCVNGDARLVDDANATGSIIVAMHNESLTCKYQVTVSEIEEVWCSGSWTSTLEGRVEICRENEYGTVCDDRWDELEAGVVCRQLKHISNGILLQQIILIL